MAFSEAGGVGGGGSAPCHRLRCHLSRMRSTPSVLRKRELQSGPSSGVPDGWLEHKPPQGRALEQRGGGGDPQPGI